MRFGARRTLLPGMVLVAAGLLLFARIPVHGSYVTDELPVMLLLGLGVGSSFPALMTLAMADAAPEDAGLASGLVNTSAQVGGALGLAVLATAAATHTKHLVDAGKPLAVALTSGYHLAFVIGAALVGVAIVVCLALAAPKRAISQSEEGVAEAAEQGAGLAPAPQHPSGPPRGSMETG
jgi:MFS family permease